MIRSRPWWHRDRRGWLAPWPFAICHLLLALWNLVADLQLERKVGRWERRLRAPDPAAVPAALLRVLPTDPALLCVCCPLLGSLAPLAVLFLAIAFRERLYAFSDIDFPEESKWGRGSDAFMSLISWGLFSIREM